jgi:uncharacterized BrkB/YihY/UPF0761 family membrane protein
VHWTVEIVWAIVATGGVGICGSLLWAALRDRSIARKHDIQGAPRELAEAIGYHSWRFVVALLVCTAAWVSLFYIPPNTPSSLLPGPIIRSVIWLGLTVAVVLQGLCEHRTRGKVLKQLRRHRGHADDLTHQATLNPKG